VTGTNTAELVDREARERIRHDLDENLLVEAAAGTGKTTELVQRIIAVLASGRATVESLVAVTFTEKAAGELKLRLRTELERVRQEAAAESDQRDHLEAALARLEEARVGTIHGFCADLLRERPVEARVDPQFQVMTEAQSDRAYREAFSLWLQEQLESPPEGVRRSLRRVSRWDRDGPTGRLEQAGRTLAMWRDFPAEWRRDPFDRDGEIDVLVERLHDFAALTRGCRNPGRDNLYRDTEPARLLSRDIRRAEEVRPRDHDGLEARLVDLAAERDFVRPRRGYGGAYGDGVERTTVLAAHGDLCRELRAFARAADADLAALLRHELMGAVERYEDLKRRAGRLDFVDLLVRAREMIRGDGAVRAHFQQRFSHIFVDEFQDTDPLQAEILLLLAAADAAETYWRRAAPAPGKLFLVGDPKQSIYRFRRADVGIYLQVKELLARSGGACLHLTTSFRAVPAIQRAVNTAFAPLMSGDAEALQAEYVELSECRPDHPGQPAVVALPVPEPYGRRNITATAIEQSLPDAVGAFVHWLIEKSGWTVTERERPAERIPVAARHVCLLFRRLDSLFAGDVARGYIQALEARGVPHLLVGGKSYHEREEVETMRVALAAIEWPDDDLSVFAALHGSLFAIGDEELLEYRHRHGRPHPFRVPAELPAHLAPIGEALGVLAHLHRGRNRFPVAETISRLLEATRAHAAFVLRPSGEQALANVLHVVELARTYERGGGISFRGFVEQLGDDADGGKTAEAPILEEGSEGVRIMTVHKAKGLEFPVVVLADMTAKMWRPPATRFIDPGRGLCALRIAGWSPVELIEHEESEEKRDQAEGVRIAYVAATRARDLLVVPAIGDAAFESGWVSPLNGALYPERLDAAPAAPPAGCPSFGSDCTLRRPDDLAFRQSGVRPGRHELGSPPYGVVWWDPSTLELHAEPLFGIRQEDLIGKEIPDAVVAADVRAHRQWEEERASLLSSAARPSLRAQTATERAREEGGESAAVEVVELPRRADRPAGARYGALVHAVLATVALDGGADDVERAARLQARILGADDVEAASAAEAVEAALRHPLLERARRAAAEGICRREVPVTFAAPGGAVIDGVVDLAFAEEGTWTVVDFKTDRDLALGLDVYRRQVALYAAGITAATGRPAVPVLLRV